MTDKEYTDKLDNIISALAKDLGKGSIMRSSSVPEEVDVISTGIIGIDRAIGVGGIPRGRITEIYGPESSGKSTLALHVIGEGQRGNLVAAYIDAEHAFDPDYAATLGVDIESLLLSQPDSGEQALEITEALVRTGEVGLVVIDSVASLVPKAELEGDMGQSFMGLQARLMGQAMRKLTGVTAKSNTALLFINQLREKLGLQFGNPETTPGGRALKFYASLRIDLRRGSAIEHGTEQEGFVCRIKTVKNKLASPYKTVEVPLMYGKGFDSLASLINQATTDSLIQQPSKGWYVLNQEKFHGITAVANYLNGNPQIKEEIENRLRSPLPMLQSTDQ